MFKKLKKYLPIKVHSIHYGYGWWFGDKVIFFEKHWIPFNIMHICFELKHLGFANGKSIDEGLTHSWDRYSDQFKN